VVVRYDPSDRKERAVYVPEANTARSSEDVRERFVCRARCSVVDKKRGDQMATFAKEKGARRRRGKRE
jgi:hypothetical protein